MFMTNRPVFFERLDRVVRCAETNEIGLIPSLFWYFATVPDLMGEPIDQLGNPQSASINYIRDYTTAIITRYRNSSAIWAWEFGNEYNLECDLPNHAEHRPPVQPGLGTPATRSERDELEFKHLRVALQAFAQTVRKLDPARAGYPPKWVRARNSKQSWKSFSVRFADMMCRSLPCGCSIFPRRPEIANLSSMRSAR
jgi:hypothetical protein